MTNVLARIVREEGITALWKGSPRYLCSHFSAVANAGLVPGLMRQMTFASIRIGLYEPVRNFYHQGAGERTLLALHRSQSHVA